MPAFLPDLLLKEIARSGCYCPHICYAPAATNHGSFSTRPGPPLKAPAGSVLRDLPEKNCIVRHSKASPRCSEIFCDSA